MLIAVNTYKNDDVNVEDTVLIFDSDTERVDIYDIDEIDTVAGLTETEYDGTVIEYGTASLMHELHNSFALTDWHVKLSYAEVDVKRREGSLILNGVRIPLFSSAVKFQCTLVYYYRVKGGYVLRFSIYNQHKYKRFWFSAVINDVGQVLAYWDADMKITFNKGMALKVDMLHAY